MARYAAAVLLAVLPAGCTTGGTTPEDAASEAWEQRIVEECTYASLSTGECVTLMHYCFHEIDKCEIMGRPIRPEE